MAPRRTFNRCFQTLFVTILLEIISLSLSTEVPYSQLNRTKEEYELPELPYENGYQGLSPYIEADTLTAHHGGHHATYTKNLNTALKQWRDSDPEDALAYEPILFILRTIDQVPDAYQTTIRNQGGGYVNHCFYWAGMSPNPAGALRKPHGQLMTDIEKDFGSFETFREQFTTKALKLFGSGYVWLSRQGKGNLVITTTVNQDLDLAQAPLLVIDVWEHSYYLKHQFRRAAYVENWWMVVDWDNVVKLDSWWKEIKEYGAYLKDEL